MADADELERRVESLRAELEALHHPTPEAQAERSALFREFAQFDDGNDKSDPNAVEERLVVYLREKGLPPDRGLLIVVPELRSAEADLAAARGEPVAIRIRVNPESLAPEPTKGLIFRQTYLDPGRYLSSRTLGTRRSYWRVPCGRPRTLPERSRVGADHVWCGQPNAAVGCDHGEIRLSERRSFGDWMVKGFDGIGFYEVLNSEWPQEIVKANRERFPKTPDDLGLRHFMVACKENTLEVLAKGFTMSRVQDRSWLGAIANYLRA